MRLKLSIFILFVSLLSANALNHIEGVGRREFIINGKDTLLLFAGNPELQTTNGDTIDWYYEDGSFCQERYPSASTIISGRGIHAVGDGWDEWVYCFDYRDYLSAWTAFSVEPHCSYTLFHIEGTAAPAALKYTNSQGVAVSYPLKNMSIRYTDLAWGENDWVDSVVVVQVPSKTGDVRLPITEAPFYGSKSYSETTFTLYDSLAIALGLYESGASDSILSSPVRPVAVKCHITSETTTREKEPKLNEINRPLEVTQLTGSAPMDILFHLNPSPAADYYVWEIYQSSTMIAHRMDESTRYTFMDPGIYKIKGRVYSMQCPCVTEDDCVADSSLFSGEVQVTVDDSDLRVPNVFTPNGDGVNDEFRVAYRSLREFHCWVYNRWGHLVYSWDDPAKGWDGTINGRPAAEGAYFYVIRALGNTAPANASYGTKIAYKKKIREGDESVMGIYRLSGSINLIRGKK